ncbi:MAG: helix-turn-helix transcriptional regulator [Acidobacteria bacterium]|nr:helix-turn-helix transcriptional regulator [Acidobacteriota bacterium]
MAAHYAYNRAARGRLSFLDQAEIEKRLQERIEEEEYQWKLRRRATARPRKQKGQPSKMSESVSRKHPPAAQQGTMADIIESHKLKEGLTDEQLAEQMDISRDTLYKLKRGESVSHEVRFKAADVLGWEPEDLPLPLRRRRGPKR